MNVSDLNFSCLSPLPSNAVSVHHCHPQKLPLSLSPPPKHCHLVFLCSDLMWFGDLTQKLGQQWGSLTLPSSWLPFLGSVSLQVSPSVTRKLDWSFDNVFSNWYLWWLLQHPFFTFLGIPADRNAFTVCAKSFSSWLEGSCCSPDYVHIRANCTAEVAHKILRFHGDLPSTFPKRTH